MSDYYDWNRPRPDDEDEIFTVSEALRDLSPLLPKLPIDPGSIHDAAVQVALRDHKPVYLKLTGKVDAGFLLGDVPFEVVLDLPRAR